MDKQAKLGSEKTIVVLAAKKEFFGATIVQIPFFLQLKQEYPNHKIILFSQVKATDLLLSLGLVDEIKSVKNLHAYPVWKLRPEIIINLRTYSLRYALVSRLSGASTKIGFVTSSFQKCFYTHSIPLDIHRYMALHYQRVLEKLDIKPNRISNAFDFISDLDRNDTQNSSTPGNTGKSISIIVSGGLEDKKWGIENVLTLSLKLIEEKLVSKISFILGSKERRELEEIQTWEQSSLKNLDTQIEILKDLPLPKLATHFKETTLILTNDCGPAHLAQLSETPVISLWGWGETAAFPKFNEWFFPRENSFALFSNAFTPLPSLKVEIVFKLVKSVLGS